MVILFDFHTYLTKDYNEGDARVADGNGLRFRRVHRFPGGVPNGGERYLLVRLGKSSFISPI